MCDVGEYIDFARRLANMGCRETKCLGRRAIETSDREVSRYYDNGKIDGVENPDQIGRQNISMHCVSTSGNIVVPTVICRRWIRHPLDSCEAVYSAWLRRRTVSAIAGRT